MKRILASVGIGNASVDTVLPSTTATPGETIDAEIHVSGGSVEQEVSAIDLELETRYATEDGYQEVTIDRLRLTEWLTIKPDEDHVIETTIDIPYTTPVTLGNVDVWVETELEIDLAVDPEDKDYLDVQPTARMQTVFDAVESLGFSFRSAECEADPYGRYTSGRRFIQEFEFRPQSGRFADDVDELELVFVPSAEQLTVYLEVDRHGGLLSELTDTDERKTQFVVGDESTSEVTKTLRSLLEQHT